MTLDRVIQGKIDDVVTEWINQGRMFTAFEVSLAVKEQGVRERHRNMRDFVHQVIFRVGGPKDYSRTLMDVGAPEQAWVYHPKSVSPYRYRPLDRSGQNPIPPLELSDLPPLRNPSGLVWGSVAQASVPPGAYGTDQRGRLCIPVTLLHGLGVDAGERIKVQCDPAAANLMITKLGENENVPADATYTAEPDGNVRLTQGTLEKAGIGGLQCYHVAGDARMITVRNFEE